MTNEFWEILDTRPVLQHQFINVELQKVRLPDNRIICDWPKIHTGEYVNIFVLDSAGHAMVIDGYKHGLGCSCWQLLSGALDREENPLAGAQRLLQESGYATKQWCHLGSFVSHAQLHVGVGHLFLAQNVRPHSQISKDSSIRWVPLVEVRRALWDGRVRGISCATGISMGLLALIDIQA